MALTNDARSREAWEQELARLREQRQARRDGVEYTPAQPAGAAAPTVQAAVQQQTFTRTAPRVEISLEQLAAESRGREYVPEQISFQRVSARTKERSMSMGNQR